MESVWELKEGYSRLVINKPSEKQHEEIKVPNSDKKLKKLPFLATLPLLFKPSYVFAASADSTFLDVYTAMLGIVDYLAVGVIIYAGVSWMFGHRTKAIENLIGGTIGYLICTHAIDIRDFIKNLGN